MSAVTTTAPAPVVASVGLFKELPTLSLHRDGKPAKFGLNHTLSKWMGLFTVAPNGDSALANLVSFVVEHGSEEQVAQMHVAVRHFVGEYLAAFGAGEAPEGVGEEGAAQPPPVSAPAATQAPAKDEVPVITEQQAARAKKLCKTQLGKVWFDATLEERAALVVNVAEVLACNAVGWDELSLVIRKAGSAAAYLAD